MLDFLRGIFFEAAEADKGGEDISDKLARQNPFEQISAALQTAENLKNAPPVDTRSDFQKEYDGRQQSDKDKSSEEDKQENAPQEDVFDLSENPVKIKVGDSILSADDIREALKDKHNKENWVKKLTQESQFTNWYKNSLSPDQQDRVVNHLLPLVYGKQELPDDFAISDIELDVEIPTKDPDTDEERSVKGKKIIKKDSEEYSKMKEHFYSQFLQEHSSTFKELKTHQENAEQFQEQQRQWQAKAANDEIAKFISDSGFNLPTEGDINKSLKEILMAGEVHPQYDDAFRLVSIAQIAQNSGIDLRKAYKSFYGKAESKSPTESVKKDQERQSRILPQKPGGSPASPIEQFSNRLQGDKIRNQVADIFSGRVK